MELLTGNAATEARRQRGLEIAATCAIARKGDNWIVPSMSGNGRYTVTPGDASPSCACPDHESRGVQVQAHFRGRIRDEA